MKVALRVLGSKEAEARILVVLMYFLRSATLEFSIFQEEAQFLSPTMPHQKFWDQQRLVEIIKNGL